MSAKEASVLSIETETGNGKNVSSKDGDRDFLMVITTFIATMAFQAGINPPGGVWDDDDKGHVAGKSIMATKSPTQFILFITGVTVCLSVSAMQLVVLLVNSTDNRRSVSKTFMFFSIGSTISFMAVAYWNSVTALTPESEMSKVKPMFWFTIGFSVLLPILVYLSKKLLSHCYKKNCLT